MPPLSKEFRVGILYVGAFFIIKEADIFFIYLNITHGLRRQGLGSRSQAAFGFNVAPSSTFIILS